MESKTPTNLTVEILEADTKQAADLAKRPALTPVLKTSGMPRFFRLRSIAILLCVWVAAGTYTGKNLMRVLIPHDDGALAQSAERVLRGQLPHRDFIEIYTGGLTYIHALAFRESGVSFAALRLTLFLFFLLWIPAVYFIATEITSDWAAGGLTLLAAAWSLVLYSAPMPSWYNLFFATFGIVALFCYVRRPTRWLLFAAGICGGLSFLVKIAALYYLAGVALFLIYREQGESQKRVGAVRKTSLGYSVFLSISLLAFLAAITRLLRLHLEMPEVIHFLVPGMAIVALLLSRERTFVRASPRNFPDSHASSAQRFKTLFGLAIPFIAGVLFPILLFLAPYYKAGALNDFFAGVFILPFKRILGASMHPPETKLMLPAVGLVSVICLSFRTSKRARLWIAGLLTLLWTLFLISSFKNVLAYAMVWQMVREMIPLVIVLGVVALHYLRKKDGEHPEESQERTMILLAITATCSLIQFPFAGPIYFCYAAPLLFLTVASVVMHFERAPKFLLTSTGVFLFLFAVFVLRPGGIWALGNYYSSNSQTATMTLPRAGGLRTTPELAERYETVIPLLRKLSGGHPILAGPDCPDVYFLGNFENPTGTMFEIFEEPAGYQERIEKLIEDKQVKVILLNKDPGFSEYFLDQLEDVADDKFPFAQTVGTFEVRWRK